VGAVHPKAMPVILHAEDYDRWLTAEWKDAKALVEPFPSQLMAVG
jgi:putative SOS response-associated peptidase YedK